MDRYFIALVVVGPKEEEEVRIGMDAGVFTTYVKELYKRICLFGHWEMVDDRG
jgi:hypothetical protein